MKWDGGWLWMRWAWALAVLITHLPRARGITDAYASSDMVFEDTLLHVNAWLPMTPALAWVLWGLAIVAALLVAQGRFAKPALLVWLPFYWILLSAEALNMKAYDRLLTWLALALLLAPGSRDLLRSWSDGLARVALILVYAALYGSTGWLKLLEEPSWLQGGEVLALHLVHPEFGSALGAKLAPAAPLLAVFTVAAEASFVFLVWFRRTNPWILAALAGMHLGIAVTMDVGPFGWVALAGYPVLLHPSIALGLYSRWRFSRRGRPAGSAGLASGSGVGTPAR